LINLPTSVTENIFMIATDIKISLRSFARNKLQFAISVLGLGIGMGCIILLLALIVHEKSFDRFIPDYKNVYRINDGESCLTQYPLAETMKEEFPEVKDFFRFYQTNDIELRNTNNEIVKDKNFGFADTSLFRILGLKIIAGIPAASKDEVAISKTTAKKYFGRRSPLGDVLQIKLNGAFINFTITGVYNDFPENSTLFPEFIADIKMSEAMFRQEQKSLGEYGDENWVKMDWTNTSFLSYVVLNKNADKASLSSSMTKYLKLSGNEKMKARKFVFQQVSDIYMGSGNLGGNTMCRSGNSEELWYYSAISLLILLIAVTNYIFLTRAGTADRLREMGTKKVLGALGSSLRRQIILESNIVAFISLVPAIIVIAFGMPFIDSTLNKTLSAGVFSNSLIWLLLLLVVLFTGTISGLVIGYKISHTSSLLLLKARTSEKMAAGGRWNYSFLVLHFTIFIILIVSVIVVSKQIRFSLTNFKGIDPKNIIIAELNTDKLQAAFPALSDEIGRMPGVVRVAGSTFVPPFNLFLPVSLATSDGERVTCDGLIMGEGMTELLGIEVIDGSPFGTFQPNANNVLINESCALKYNVKAGDKFLNVFNVMGVLKDFHAHSLHRLIQPMIIIQQNPVKMDILAIKTDGRNDNAIKKRLHELFSQISPNEVFEMKYLTEQIDEFYGAEKNQAKIIGAFSILATVLSIMGLFGIALISINKRTKEIGVRKVNGASVIEILQLINNDFIRWVLLSIAVSIPVSVYLVNIWLKRFAYKTDLNWWIFAVASLSALIIAVLTVSWQSWKAATRNPVEALRYE
jgi:putative ABC transport system permease protein